MGSAQALSSEGLYFLFRGLGSLGPMRGGVPLGWDPSTSPHVGELSHWRGLSIVGAHPEDLRCKRREWHRKEFSLDFPPFRPQA